MSNHQSLQNKRGGVAAVLAGALMLPSTLECDDSLDVLSFRSQRITQAADNDTLLAHTSFQDPVVAKDKQDPKSARMLLLIDAYASSTSSFITECIKTIEESTPIAKCTTKSLDRATLAKSIAITDDADRRDLTIQIARVIPTTPSEKDIALRLLGRFKESESAKVALTERLANLFPEELLVLMAENQAHVEIIAARNLDTLGYRPNLFGNKESPIFMQKKSYQFNLFKIENGNLIDIRAQQTRPTSEEFYGGRPQPVQFGYDDFFRTSGRPSIHCEIRVQAHGKKHHGSMAVQTGQDIQLYHGIDRRLLVVHFDRFAERSIPIDQPKDQIDSLATLITTGSYKISLEAVTNPTQVKEWRDAIIKSSPIITSEGLAALDKALTSESSALATYVREAERSAQSFESYLRHRLNDDEKLFSAILNPEGLGTSPASLPRPGLILSSIKEDKTGTRNRDWLRQTKADHEKRMVDLKARLQRL